MIFAVISDIHANKEALDAVLAQIDGMGIETIYCLGDLVGYNADPDACVDTVRARAAEVIRGNHDKAVAGLLNLDWFNSAARAAAQWTRATVRADTLETVRQLREGPRPTGEGTILLCHGTPYDEDAYLMDAYSVDESFRTLDSQFPAVRFCFIGHTHIPTVVVRKKRTARPQVMEWRETVELDTAGVSLINPGSVGQPRDGIPLASFGILDSGEYGLQEYSRTVCRAGDPAEDPPCGPSLQSGASARRGTINRALRRPRKTRGSRRAHGEERE